jgi:hypothetical protein
VVDKPSESVECLSISLASSVVGRTNHPWQKLQFVIISWFYPVESVSSCDACIGGMVSFDFDKKKSSMVSCNVARDGYASKELLTVTSATKQHVTEGRGGVHACKRKNRIDDIIHIQH